MVITDDRIDAGKAFDWGRTSEKYAKYRDIYPGSIALTGQVPAKRSTPYGFRM